MNFDENYNTMYYINNNQIYSINNIQTIIESNRNNLLLPPLKVNLEKKISIQG